MLWPVDDCDARVLQARVGERRRKHSRTTEEEVHACAYPFAEKRGAIPLETGNDSH